MAFVELDERGERSFSFAKKPAAGDSFRGGFPSRILSYNRVIEKLEWEEIGQCALTGNVVAALCVQSRGGIPSIPGKEHVELFIRNNRKRCSYD